MWYSLTTCPLWSILIRWFEAVLTSTGFVWQMTACCLGSKEKWLAPVALAWRHTSHCDHAACPCVRGHLLGLDCLPVFARLQQYWGGQHISCNCNGDSNDHRDWWNRDRHYDHDHHHDHDDDFDFHGGGVKWEVTLVAFEEASRPSSLWASEYFASPLICNSHSRRYSEPDCQRLTNRCWSEVFGGLSLKLVLYHRKLECSKIVPLGSFWAHYCDWVHSDEPLHIDAQRCSWIAEVLEVHDDACAKYALLLGTGAILQMVEKYPTFFQLDVCSFFKLCSSAKSRFVAAVRFKSRLNSWNLRACHPLKDMELLFVLNNSYYISTRASVWA